MVDTVVIFSAKLCISYFRMDFINILMIVFSNFRAERLINEEVNLYGVGVGGDLNMDQLCELTSRPFDIHCMLYRDWMVALLGTRDHAPTIRDSKFIIHTYEATRRIYLYIYNTVLVPVYRYTQTLYTQWFTFYGYQCHYSMIFIVRKGELQYVKVLRYMYLLVFKKVFWVIPSVYP